jgi:hypothetical protein
MNKAILLISLLSLLTLNQVNAEDHPRRTNGIPSYAYAAAGNAVPGTYLLGGLIFTGDHPINNPVDNGDLGYAMLFRLDDDAIVPIDTAVVDTLGYFYFLDLVPGKYLIKAGLSPESPGYSAYIPTYFGGHTRWNMTDTLMLTSHIYNADIHLCHVEISGDGYGHIRGFTSVLDATVNDGREPYCEVVLANAMDLPIGYTITDGNGNFGFEQLPAGDYHIWADLTGKFSQKVSHKITSVLPYADSIEIRLSNVLQGISMLSKAGKLEVNFYPNPASERITLHYSGTRSENYFYFFYSLSGMQVLSGAASFDANIGLKDIDISRLPSGIYSLVLRSADNSEVIFEKVMKK